MIKRLGEFSEYLFTIQEDEDERIGPHAFPIIVKENAPFTRDELVDYLDKHEIDTRDLFSSMPTQCPGFAYLGYKLGEFPNAEYMGNHGFHIGVHQDINDGHIDYIFSTLKSFIDIKVK
jgi:dTDP-4-amino-4,6-dideoxygalactose transaminase